MKALMLLVLIMNFLMVYSQEPVSDTIRELSEVVVTARRLDRFSAGLQFQSINTQRYSSTPEMLLSGFLSGQSANYIRTYGAGGLATISMRGTSAHHTTVYWNGFNINPPNIGLADLSMLPLFLFDRVDVVSGGSSTLFGNGSIGGSIHLNSQNGLNEPHLQAALTVGQFSHFMAGLSSGYHIGKLRASTSFWFDSNQNDFEYENTAKAGSPTENLTNADARNLGVLQELLMPLNKGHMLKSGFWFQQKEAGVPPSMTMNQSVARQFDRMVRAYLQWTLQKEKMHYSLKSGYNNDFLHYSDSLISLDSKIRVGVWNSEAEIGFSAFEHTYLSAGANLQFFNTDIDSYTEEVDEGQASLFFLVNQTLPSLKWNISLGFRKEFNTSYDNTPLAVSLGWRGLVVQNLFGRINLSTNYRIPTLNDRYWQPGGNPDLKSETSLNIETGLDYDFEFFGSHNIISVTFFNNRVKDWITWLPTSSYYWSPENVSSVYVYGLESKLNSSFMAFRTFHNITVSYSGIRSLYNANSFSDRISANQMIYTPVHNLSLVYRADYNGWAFQYIHKFTGAVYTDRANTNELPGYNVADLGLSRKLTIPKVDLTINATLNNIANTAYQVIQYRPMPGRTFSISLIMKLSINKPITNF